MVAEGNIIVLTNWTVPEGRARVYELPVRMILCHPDDRPRILTQLAEDDEVAQSLFPE